MCSGHYFKRRLGLANGIVTAGSSVFTIALSFINQFILETHGVGLNSVRGYHNVITFSCKGYRVYKHNDHIFKQIDMI